MMALAESLSDGDLPLAKVRLRSTHTSVHCYRTQLCESLTSIPCGTVPFRSHARRVCDCATVCAPKLRCMVRLRFGVATSCNQFRSEWLLTCFGAFDRMLVLSLWSYGQLLLLVFYAALFFRDLFECPMTSHQKALGLFPSRCCPPSIMIAIASNIQSWTLVLFAFIPNEILLLFKISKNF